MPDVPMIYSAFGKNIEDMDRDELLSTLRVAIDSLKMRDASDEMRQFIRDRAPKDALCEVDDGKA